MESACGCCIQLKNNDTFVFPTLYITLMFLIMKTEDIFKIYFYLFLKRFLYLDSSSLICCQQKKPWRLALIPNCETLLLFGCWGPAYLLYSCGNQANPERSQLSLPERRYIVSFTDSILHCVPCSKRFKCMQCSLIQKQPLNITYSLYVSPNLEAEFNFCPPVSSSDTEGGGAKVPASNPRA